MHTEAYLQQWDVMDYNCILSELLSVYVLKSECMLIRFQVMTLWYMQIIELNDIRNYSVWEFFGGWNSYCFYKVFRHFSDNLI